MTTGEGSITPADLDPESTKTPGHWTRRPPETTSGKLSHPHATITADNDPATNQPRISQPVKD